MSTILSETKLTSPPNNLSPVIKTTTDDKIYTAVVKNGVLARLGACLLIASSVGYFVVSTYCVWGIALAVATIAVAKLLPASKGQAPSIIDETRNKNETDKKQVTPSSWGSGGGYSKAYPSAPFVEGQPIGLRNAGMNCWANALFQFLKHSSHLRQEIPPFGNAFGNAFARYEEHQGHRERIATNVNSQHIRNWFAQGIRGFSNRDWEQQDAHEPLAHLMGNHTRPIDMEENISDELRTTPSYNIHTISLEGHQNLDFVNLIAQNYLQVYPGAGHFACRFARPPPYLVFHLNRFAGNWGQQHKICDPIRISIDMHFPATWARSRQEADYTCQAFIVHIGGSMYGGHYVAYVHTAGQWWCCDDTRVDRVSDAEALRQLGHCYIAYYHKRG